MAEYKKILVAYDGSESGKNALRQTIRLAVRDKSWVKVVAVIPSYEGDLDMTAVGNLNGILYGSAEKLISEARGIASEERFPIMTDIEQGEIYEKIVEVADEEHCDLIVLGRNGNRPIDRALMGRVTSRVIGHTDKDVLVIPGGSALGWGMILLATDGSPHSGAATEKAVRLASSHSGSLTAISVVDVNDEFIASAPDIAEKLVEKARATLEGVSADAKSEGVSVEIIVKEGEPYEKIIEAAGEGHADLILMGSRGRTGISRLLIGSVAEKVIGLSDCPVLISTKTR